MIWFVDYLFICAYSGLFLYAIEPELLEELFNEEDLGYDPQCISWL